MITLTKLNALIDALNDEARCEGNIKTRWSVMTTGESVFDCIRLSARFSHINLTDDETALCVCDSDINTAMHEVDIINYKLGSIFVHVDDEEVSVYFFIHFS